MSGQAARLSPRDKQRLYRDRKREKKRELRGCYCNPGDIADALIERGFLQQWDAENPQKIIEAAAEFLKRNLLE